MTEVVGKDLKTVWMAVDILRHEGFEVDAKRAMRAVKQKMKLVECLKDKNGRVWAIVKNGEGKEYEVRISVSEKIVRCSCEDHKYRKTVCKHAIFVFLNCFEEAQEKAKKKQDDLSEEEVSQDTAKMLSEMEGPEKEEVEAFYGW